MLVSETSRLEWWGKVGGDGVLGLGALNLGAKGHEDDGVGRPVTTYYKQIYN